MTALEGKALLDHGNAIARRYARRLGADLAEELGAEAVVRALRSPPPDGRIEPWLERIYRNLLVDSWRRNQVAAARTDGSRLATTRTPEDELLSCERRRVVRRSLGQLPREARRALLVRFYGELDDDIAATRLGVATATVRTRIHRALARLRRGLADLRGWCPPLLGRLGMQATTVGLAPALVAVLVVVGGSAPTQSQGPREPAAAVSVETRQPIPAAAPAFPKLPSPVPPALSAPPLRPLKKVAPITSPAPVLTAGSAVPLVVEILRPDGSYILAEPAPPACPSMVEAPPSMLGQIDKMMESL